MLQILFNLILHEFLFALFLFASALLHFALQFTHSGSTVRTKEILIIKCLGIKKDVLWINIYDICYHKCDI